MIRGSPLHPSHQIRSHRSDEFPPHRLSKQQMIRTITKVINQMTTSFLSIDFIVFPLFLQLYIKPHYLLHLVKTRNLNWCGGSVSSGYIPHLTSASGGSCKKHSCTTSIASVVSLSSDQSAFSIENTAIATSSADEYFAGSFFHQSFTSFLRKSRLPASIKKSMCLEGVGNCRKVLKSLKSKVIIQRRSTIPKSESVNSIIFRFAS